MSDTLEIFGRTFPAAEGIKAYDSDGNLLTFVKAAKAVITDSEDSNGGTIREITVQDTLNLQSGKTITPTSTEQTVLPDSGYDGFANIIVENEKYGLDKMITRIFPQNTIIETDLLFNTPYVFYGCRGITNVKLTGAVRGNNTNGWWFYNCTDLITFEAPLSIEVGRSTLQGCTSLQSVSLPLVQHVSVSCFQGCTSLTTLVLPSFYRSYSSAFSGCTNLESLDICGIAELTSTGFQESNAFYNCRKLNTIIIRSDWITNLGNINSFTHTPFASGGTGGTIYIPKSLYDHLGDGTSLDYKAATNWSTIDGYGTITWQAIEGSYYETHYADGTLID